MPKYKAVVHVTGISADNPGAVRSALDEQLRKGGFENCRVVAVDLEGAPAANLIGKAAASARGARETGWRRQANIGGLLLVAAAAWAIWFFWWMLSSAPN